jgi:hypothetical protein
LLLIEPNITIAFLISNNLNILNERSHWESGGSSFTGFEIESNQLLRVCSRPISNLISHYQCNIADPTTHLQSRLEVGISPCASWSQQLLTRLLSMQRSLHRLPHIDQHCQPKLKSINITIYVEQNIWAFGN